MQYTSPNLHISLTRILFPAKVFYARLRGNALPALFIIQGGSRHGVIRLLPEDCLGIIVTDTASIEIDLR